MHWIWMGFYHVFAMFWETLWVLVLGFGISAALQVFVSKKQMSRLFGRTNLKTMSQKCDPAAGKFRAYNKMSRCLADPIVVRRRNMK
jgi:hypothetical protein